MGALVAPVCFELEPLLLCFFFIFNYFFLFQALVAPVYFEVEPLIVALVLCYLGPLLLLFILN